MPSHLYIATHQESTGKLFLSTTPRKKRNDYQPLAEQPVKLICTQNGGFSQGCNVGFGISSGRHLLFLNSDTLISSNLFPECTGYLDDHPEVGCYWGSKPSFRMVFWITVAKEVSRPCKMRSTILPVWIAAILQIPSTAAITSFIWIRRKSSLSTPSPELLSCRPGLSLKNFRDLIRVSLCYGEDLDYCYRVKKSGWNVMYYPRFSILHLKGQSGLAMRGNDAVEQFYRSMKLFYRKHYHQHNNMVTNLLVYLGITGLYLWKRS